jgi:arabinofuranan 3-O-arabinosyltransferase
VVHWLLALLAWVPLLLTGRGRVASDTRQDMYLDPSGFLARARHLWDPMVHFGTVTHQNLGLLVPMGAWFWTSESLGLPTWLAQRLWLGAIIFAAGAGVLHLGRTLAWQLPAATVTAVCYALSPYLLQYATRTSVLLLPFAGLPWMLSLVVRAARSGGWRHPALLALVVFLVGSVNATSLILVGLAPALWLPYAVSTGELTARRALSVAAKVGGLSLLVSLWWVVALAVQSRYGLPVLTYTETIDDVATTAAAPEVVRGLGYWVFYGREVLDPNVGAAVAYTQNPLLLTISYLLPALGLLSAVLVRFRHRAFFAGLIVVGAFVAVGAHPVDDPSALASAFRSAADSTAGLALRSSTRAVPLVALGLATCLGQGVAALARTRRRSWVAVGGISLLAVANLPALVTGGFVDDGFSRPEHLPEHWTDAAAWLKEQEGPGAVLELPGIQYATYRWGTTYEPVTPGLVDRPVIAREQLPYGSAPSADLLIALDRRLQEGVPDQAALGAVARLLGARWVLLRNDLAFERYVSPRPRTLWSWFAPVPAGLKPAASFGDPVENVPDPRLPLLDEEALGLPDDVDDPAPIELFEVDHPRSPVRLERADRVVVVDGDGDGVVDAAAAGLLEGDPTLLYGSTLLQDDDVLDRTLDGHGPIVVTDTNRKRVRRWRSVRWGTGYTQRADEDALSTGLGDAGLDVFDPVPDGSQSVVVQRGATVTASAYGGPLTLDPDARPALAADGRVDSAWVVGPLADPIGERLRIEPDQPVVADHITVVQRQAPADQHISEIDVRIDGGAPQRVVLDASSTVAPGQVIPLPGGPVTSLELEIAAVAGGPGAPSAGSPVGFAEVALPGVVVDEMVELPTGLLQAAGDAGALADRAVTYVLTRLRSDPTEPVRADEERQLRRRILSPVDQTLTLSGEARLSPHAAGPLLDVLVGRTGPVASSSSALPGALDRRASAAIDGDTATRWEPAFLDLRGAWLDVDVGAPITVDRLDLVVVADGRHSVPTRLDIDVDGQVQSVAVPPLRERKRPGATRTVSIPLTPVTGQHVRVTVAEVAARATTDYYSHGPIELPIGIAELRIPGLVASVPSEAIDTGCRSDLVTVDGVAVPVRISGATAAAFVRRPLVVAACQPVALAPGTHVLEAAEGAATGLDLDRLVLSTGDPLLAIDPTAPTPAENAPLPDVRISRDDATAIDGTLAAGAGGWLVLGQSHNQGWRATLDGIDLGPPRLVDGASNGWLVDGSDESRALHLEWTPQRWVDRGLLASALGVVLCLLLALAGRRRSWQSEPAEPVVAPLTSRPTRVGGIEALAVVGLGSLAAVAIHPVAGVVVLAAAVASLVIPAGGAITGATVVAAWTAAAGWVIVTQLVDPRRPDFEWIAGSGTPHRLTLLALLLLLTLAVTDHLRHRQQPEADLAVGTTWGDLTWRVLGAIGIRPRRVAVSPATGDRPADEGIGARRRRARPDEDGHAAAAVTRRFVRASAAGAVAALLVFGWLITLGRADLTSWQRVGDFYDGQAKAWLDGHWDMAPETLGIERFEARGKAYMYQGPWPAVLRVPVVTVTDRFEGRMTQGSMLAAFAVAMAGASLLHWRVRQLVRGAASLGRAETLATALATFTVGAGSALLFVGSRAWVYHEAIAWGVAWSLVAFAAIVGCVAAPTWRRLAMAGGAAALALCSRSSVGLGPVAALGLLAVGNLLARRGSGEGRGPWHQRVLHRLSWFGGAPTRTGRRPVIGPLLASVLPVGVYAATNWIKFRTLFSIPFTSQGFTLVDDDRRQMLAENHGTLFGLKFVPTTLGQYVRPDAISFTRAFPFVDLPAPAHPVGGVNFDLIDRAGSIPTTMPALTVLAVVAVIALVRGGRTERGQGIGALRIPAAGALAGALLILPFGYIANRYLADAVPLMAIVGLVGLQVVLGWATTARPRRRATVLSGLAVLAVVSVWVNASFGVIYGRVYSGAKDDDIASIVDLRYDVSQRIGLDPDIPIQRYDVLPEQAPRGTLAVVGDDCDALYISDGMELNDIKVSTWNAVERTEEGGRWLRRITFPAQPEGTREPLWSMTSADGPGVLYAEWAGGEGVRFTWTGPGQPHTTPVRHIPAGKEWLLDLVADPHMKVLQVWLDDFLMVETYYEPTGVVDERAIGVDLTGDPTIADAFTGRLEALPERRGVCDELLEESAAR